MPNPKMWPQILLCGIITGGVWFLLSSISIVLFGAGFISSLQPPHLHPRNSPLFFLAIDLVMGIWAIWLFSIIRRNFSNPWSSAFVVGIFWWSLKTLQSAKWVGLGVLPNSPTITLVIATLVSVLASTLFGSWLFERSLRLKKT